MRNPNLRTKIEALETAAGTAGDLLQAAICQIALHGKPKEETLEALTPEQRVELHRRFDDFGAGDGWRRLAAAQECDSVICDRSPVRAGCERD